MSVLDIIIIIPLLWGAYKGFTKGLIIELAGFVALALGVYGAIKLSGYTSDIIKKWFDTKPEYLEVISFAVTFLIIIILVHLLSRLIDKFIKAAALGIFNRIAGGFFGILKFSLILGIVIILLNNFDKNATVLSSETKDKSLLYRPLEKIILKIYPSINGFIEEQTAEKITN